MNRLNKDKDLIQLIEALSMKLYAIEKKINDKSYNFEFINDDFTNKNLEEQLKYIEKIGIPELNHKDEFQIIYNQITNNQSGWITKKYLFYCLIPQNPINMIRLVPKGLKMGQNSQF